MGDVPMSGKKWMYFVKDTAGLSHRFNTSGEAAKFIRTEYPQEYGSTMYPGKYGYLYGDNLTSYLRGDKYRRKKYGTMLADICWRVETAYVECAKCGRKIYEGSPMVFVNGFPDTIFCSSGCVGEYFFVLEHSICRMKDDH